MHQPAVLSTWNHNADFCPISILCRFTNPRWKLVWSQTIPVCLAHVSPRHGCRGFLLKSPQTLHRASCSGFKIIKKHCLVLLEQQDAGQSMTNALYCTIDLQLLPFSSTFCCCVWIALITHNCFCANCMMKWLCVPFLNYLMTCHLQDGWWQHHHKKEFFLLLARSDWWVHCCRCSQTNNTWSCQCLHSDRLKQLYFIGDQNTLSDTHRIHNTSFDVNCEALFMISSTLIIALASSGISRSRGNSGICSLIIHPSTNKLKWVCFLTLPQHICMLQGWVCYYCNTKLWFHKKVKLNNLCAFRLSENNIFMRNLCEKCFWTDATTKTGIRICLIFISWYISLRRFVRRHLPNSHTTRWPNWTTIFLLICQDLPVCIVSWHVIP